MYSRSFNTAREQNYWRPLYQLKLAARQGLGDWRLCCGDGFVSLLSPNCPSMARDHFDWNRRGMANSALGGKGIVCGSREGRIIGSQIAARSSIPYLNPISLTAPSNSSTSGVWSNGYTFAQTSIPFLSMMNAALSQIPGTGGPSRKMPYFCVTSPCG